MSEPLTPEDSAALLDAMRSVQKAIVWDPGWRTAYTSERGVRTMFDLRPDDQLPDEAEALPDGTYCVRWWDPGGRDAAHPPESHLRDGAEDC